MNPSYLRLLKTVFQDELITAILQTANNLAESERAGCFVILNNCYSTLIACLWITHCLADFSVSNLLNELLSRMETCTRNGCDKADKKENKFQVHDALVN